MVQKIIMSFAILGLITVFVLSAFDYRFRWFPVPVYVSSTAIHTRQVCNAFVAFRSAMRSSRSVPHAAV